MLFWKLRIHPAVCGVEMSWGETVPSRRPCSRPARTISQPPESKLSFGCMNRPAPGTWPFMSFLKGMTGRPGLRAGGELEIRHPRHGRPELRSSRGRLPPSAFPPRSRRTLRENMSWVLGGPSLPLEGENRGFRLSAEPRFNEYGGLVGVKIILPPLQVAVSVGVAHSATTSE